MDPLRLSLREGDVVAGKYRVERVVGAGGMGVVVAAMHLQLEERVALKLMLPEAAQDGELVQRFVREGRAARMLKSEHVARVHDVGKLDDGTPFMVMEYLEGEDLGAVLDRRGKVSLEEAANFVLQACDAIGEAHALDIVHRDVKPSNLFVVEGADGQPLVKVLDFGISKITSLNDSGLSMTRTKAIIGSPIYMSPEQMKSARDVDSRGDVWSLGVILYELVAGRPPYTAETLGALMALVFSEPPPRLEQFVPSIPKAYADLCASCLERDRRKRCPDVATLARALAPFAPAAVRSLAERIAAVQLKSTDPRSARTLPGTPVRIPMSSDPLLPIPTNGSEPRIEAAQPVSARHTSTAWGHEKKTRAKRPASIAIAIAALLLAAVVAIVIVVRRGARPDPSPVAAAGVTSSAPPRAAAPPTASAPAAEPVASVASAPIATVASAAVSIASRPPPVAPTRPTTTTAPAPTHTATTTHPDLPKPGIFDRN